MKPSLSNRIGEAAGSGAMLPALVLVLVAVAIFSPSIFHGPCEFDDWRFIFSNPDLRQGLSLAGVTWAFQAGATLVSRGVEYWMPLTILTRLADAQFSGLAPWWCHMVNVLLHGTSTALLFLAIFRMTGERWKSFIVALVFAVHPLQVESVAWVSGRRDLMGGLFWMITLCAYAWYVEKRGRGRYLILLAAYVGAILSKPSVVTLPAALLLLDFWPLRRFAREKWQTVVAEKLPLCLLAGFCLFTSVMAQSDLGAFQPASEFPMSIRLANAANSYVEYLKDFFVPVGLAPAYPHAGKAFEMWRAWLALGLLGPVTIAAILWRNRFPWLFVGWFWFGGVLVPMLQLTQMGDVSRADRYMYVPLLGITVALVWGSAKIGATLFPAKARMWGFAGAALWCCVLAGVTCLQLWRWGDSRRLWNYTVAVTPPNTVALLCVGSANMRAEDVESAKRAYLEVIRLDYRIPSAWMSMGRIGMRQERFDEAVYYFERAARLNPKDISTLANLAKAYESKGDQQSAMGTWETVLGLRPDWELAEAKLRKLREGRSPVDREAPHGH